MAKVIKVNGEIISIGTDNGSIKEVRACDLSFVPVVGDEVEIFENEGSTIVTKKESKKEQPASSGININVSSTFFCCL